MGKPIQEADYRMACAQIDHCRAEKCRNGRGGPDEPPCKPCIKAFQLKKEYERVKRRIP